MKKYVNKRGFNKAMKAGEPWTVLDCDLSETKDGWYYEIQKTVFHRADWIW